MSGLTFGRSETSILSLPSKVFTHYMLTDSDIPESIRHSKAVTLRVCYFAGGIVNLYQQWFRGDLDCSLNDITIEIGKLLQLEAEDMF